MKKIRRQERIVAIFVVLSWLSVASAAEAADRYIRQGATGNGSGSDWTNACPGFTGACAVSALVRGDTYYVADGSYGSLTLNTPVSGAALITIKKATSASHGMSSGWSDAYGDGQAVFGDLVAITNYWVFDGQTRSESSWSNIAAYGFRFTGEIQANTISNGAGSSNMTFRYVDVGGPAGTTYSASNPGHGFYLGGFGSVLSNWIISRSHIHNIERVPFQLAGASNITIEYSWIGPNWNKETIRGQIRASNIIIRHNVLKNGCQNGPAAEGCTADIGMWDGGSGAFDGTQIYGNIIWRTVTNWVSDGIIFIGGDGGATAAGASANNVLVYNNTFVSASDSGNHNIRFPGSHTGNIARNNIWYLTGGASTGCTANVCDNNSVFTSSPFADAANGNFRLRSPLAGAALAGPYDMDLTGTRRGSDGTWDRGALEFGGSQTQAPYRTIWAAYSVTRKKALRKRAPIARSRFLLTAAEALLFLLVSAPRLGAEVPIYTSANPPATPALSSLQLQSSVSKDGITWTFQQAARVGQFINGDYYVVGPVTVTSISPAPANGRNGSVLNLPGCRAANADKSGFDNRTQGERYSASVAATLPVQLAPGDALISSISVNTVGTLPRVMRPEDATISPVRTVSVLYSVANPLPPDAFRPSYCGRQSNFYYSRNVRRNLLPGLSPVQGTPSIAQFAGYFRRPWIDTLFFGFDAPVEYMPDYGREVGRVVGHAALLLLLNTPAAEREPLLVYFVQYGIDLHGVVSAGHPGWTGWGGHGSGRKLPILMAGALLGQSAMSSLGSADFGEDVQTVIATAPPYGPGWAGQTAMYAGHMGLTGESVNVGWGPYEHLQPSNWLSFIGEDYRRCCTSVAWIGQALAAKTLGLQAAWQHDAFFAYANRWMTEDDSVQVAAIRSQTGRDYSASWQRQRQTWDPFVDAMWRAYWDLALGGTPTAPQNLRIVQ